jgi:hypothetical protein
MGTFVISDRPTWLGDHDMSCYAHTVAIDYGAETVDDTTLCDTTRSNIGGLKTFGFSVDAYADFVDGGPSVDMFGRVGQALPFTAGTDTAEQSIAYLINARQLTSSPLSGSVGDIAGMNVGGNAVGSLVRGIVEVNRTVTADGASTGFLLGAVTSVQDVFSNLHITGSSGGTFNVKVQSDDNSDFTSATDRITFATANGVTSEHLNISGAITDTYWRVSWTLAAGSASFAVAIGIA